MKRPLKRQSRPFYQDPLFSGSTLFGAEEAREQIDKCNEKALRLLADAGFDIYSGEKKAKINDLVSKSYDKYYNNKNAEMRSIGASDKRAYRLIGKSASHLLDLLKSTTSASLLVIRRNSRPLRQQQSDRTEGDIIHEVRSCLEKLSAACSKIDNSPHQSGRRKNHHVGYLVLDLVRLYEFVSGEKFRKSIEVLGDSEGFTSPQAQFVGELAKTIDADIQTRQVRTALKSVPAAKKSRNRSSAGDRNGI